MEKKTSVSLIFWVAEKSQSFPRRERVLNADFNLFFVKFSRYLPQNPHPVTVYVRDGVNVDKFKSNSKQVTLTNLVQSTTGRYRCEVSTEAPRFDTVSQFGDLLVVGKFITK